MFTIPPTTSETTLDILTLNTWGFAWPLARDRKRRFGRIAKHLQTASYDVVALQEMWGGARESLGTTGLDWVGDEARDNPRFHMEQSGLGVKVREGLDRGVRAMRGMFRSFKQHRGFDRIKNKGFMAVEVPAGDHRVGVVNTHLQAGPTHGKVRRSQLDEILEAIDGYDHPVIICGDFNLFEDSAEDRAGHASLARNGFTDASLMIDRPQATYLQNNPYVGGGVDQRFDRIYLRDGRASDGAKRTRLASQSVEVIVNHDQPMSDHEAVAARITIY